MFKKVKYLGFILIVMLALPAMAQDLYRVKLLPFSSRNYNDFAPMAYDKGLIFCSDRKVSVLVDYKTTDDTRLLNIFYVERKDSLKWGSPRLLSRDISTVFNEGPAAYNEATKTLFFTRNLSTDKKNKTTNSYGLFYARWTGARWTNIRAFQYNDPNYKMAHPSLSKDGKTLYFSSDMPGGYGKADIYKSTLLRGRWTAPENLGPEINSASSELYPFILNKDRIYFSSDRLGGKGRLDIYTSSLSMGKWTSPLSLEEPINSKTDDFGFISNNTASSGYFSSGRSGIDDIYSFDSTVPSMMGCEEQKENKYCYIFYDRQMSDLDTVPNLIFRWDLGDGTIKHGVKIRHCYEKAGVYEIRLDVMDTLTASETFMEQSYSMVNAKAREQVYITAPDTCIAGKEVQLSGDESNLPGIEITEYFWDFDNGQRSKQKNAVTVFQNEGTFRVRLLVKSKADSFGQVQEFCGYKNIIVILPLQ